MQVDGHCHCGQITFEAEIDPETISVCHCRDCQALTGSPFRVTAICTAADVKLTGGTPKVYGKHGDNGRMRFQHFCSDCGSPLFTSGDGDQAGDWGIRWGSIRQRDALRPVRQIWCSRRPYGSTRCHCCRGGRGIEVQRIGVPDLPVWGGWG